MWCVWEAALSGGFVEGASGERSRERAHKGADRLPARGRECVVVWAPTPAPTPAERAVGEGGVRWGEGGRREEGEGGGGGGGRARGKALGSARSARPQDHGARRHQAIEPEGAALWQGWSDHGRACCAAANAAPGPPTTTTRLHCGEATPRRGSGGGCLSKSNTPPWHLSGGSDERPRDLLGRRCEGEGKRADRDRACNAPGSGHDGGGVLRGACSLLLAFGYEGL